jgi:Domain of unknown function (DUF4123)
MNDAPRLAAIAAELWPPSSRFTVYAVLDAARDERIYPGVKGSELDHLCLYAGRIPRQLELAAPYLVRLEREARFTAELLRAGWGESWGIFLIATAGLEEMRRHLRKLLRVEDERGKKLIFRYYDPRVLREYLPTCTPGELRLLFGPAGIFFAEGEDPGELLRFHRAVDGRLERTAVPLAAPPG